MVIYLPNYCMSDKEKLWLASNKNLYAITIAAANIGEKFPGGDYDKIRREVERVRGTVNHSTPALVNTDTKSEKKSPYTNSHPVMIRYKETHKLWAITNLPNVVKDGHYQAPLPVDPGTHSGLVKFMVNYINWVGGNARSHNVVARASDVTVTEESGNKFTDKRYTKSSKKGIADVQGTLKGKSLQLDAKIGKDKPSEHQLKEQVKQRKADGIYEFMKTPEQFIDFIDSLLYG